MTEQTYNEGSRRLQDRFDTRRLADRLDEKFVQHPVIEPEDKEFIERLDMFFLATADAEGRPQCSYKGGDPGFVAQLPPSGARAADLGVDGTGADGRASAALLLGSGAGAGSPSI